MYQMQLAENYEELSREFADMLVETVKRKANAVIVVATGDSPRLGYKIFVERVKKEQINVSQVTFIKLDEWIGLSSTNPATCEYFIQQELLIPLGIKKEAYISFDCEEEDKQLECRRVENMLNKLGGIDLAILGVGKNGHLGLNEPDKQLQLGPHTVELDKKTKTHSMLLETTTEVAFGITLGIGNLFMANQIILLISGEGKEGAVEKFLDQTVSTQVPVTLLKLHPNLHCIAEKQLVIN